MREYGCNLYKIKVYLLLFIIIYHLIYNIILKIFPVLSKLCKFILLMIWFFSSKSFFIIIFRDALVPLFPERVRFW